MTTNLSIKCKHQSESFLLIFQIKIKFRFINFFQVSKSVRYERLTSKLCMTFLHDLNSLPFGSIWRRNGNHSKRSLLSSFFDFNCPSILFLIVGWVSRCSFVFLVLIWDGWWLRWWCDDAFVNDGLEIFSLVLLNV